MKPLTQEECDQINAWVQTTSLDDKTAFITKLKQNPMNDADIIRATLNPQN